MLRTMLKPGFPKVRRIERQNLTIIPNKLQSRIIYFLHVHKSGGSTFVNLARKNNEKFYFRNANGNPLDNKGSEFLWKLNEKEFFDFMDSKKFTFVANERYLKFFFKNPMIKYVTVIRHPIDILLSCFNHNPHKNISFFNFIETMQRTSDDLYFRCPLIKYLSGCDDMDLAIQRIKLFDAVIMLDNYRKDIMKMKDMAGWTILDTNRFRTGTRRNSRAKGEMTEKEYNVLCEVFKKDIEFYEYIRTHIATT